MFNEKNYILEEKKTGQALLVWIYILKAYFPISNKQKAPSKEKFLKH